MNVKAKNTVSLICDLLIVALTAYSVAGFFTRGGQGNMEVIGATCFRYFTVDSNILAALASAVMAFYGIRTLAGGKPAPQWALAFKFVNAVAVGVTFFTVMLFLGPTLGYAEMLAGTNLFMHLVTPLLAMLSFALFETDSRLERRKAAAGLLPTAIYGAMYIVMVLLTGVWEDFYGFNRGGLWYVSVIAMLSATAVLCVGLCALHNALCGKQAEEAEKVADLPDGQ